MNNVTIKAAEGATVTIGGIKMNSAHVFGANGNVKHDYVLEREVPDTNNSFIVVYDASNLRFEGLTFTKVVDIENLREETSIDGVSFKNCKFNINNITENKTEYYGIRFYDNSNNGKLKILLLITVSSMVAVWPFIPITYGTLALRTVNLILPATMLLQYRLLTKPLMDIKAPAIMGM